MVSKFDRRSLLLGGVAAAGLAGASALGLGWDDIAAASTNGPGRNGVSKATPKKGGSLTFGVNAEEQGFDPTKGRFDQVGVMYARTVFDPLTIVLSNGDWAPYLAESVVPNSTYTTWTITLRPNVVFHDGTPCDGAALVTNLEAQSKSLLTGLVLSPTLQSITQTGPLSAAISFKKPWVPFPYYLSGGIGGQIAYVVAPSMLANPNGTSHPVGTGPFVFKEWIPNDHFTATANPSYWRPGLPHLSEITFKPIPNEEARAEALKSGTIDLMVTDTPQIITQFRGNRSYSYIDDSTHVAGEPDMNCIQLNCLKPPFNSATVRLAAAMAVNRIPVRPGHRRQRARGQQRPVRAGIALLRLDAISQLQPVRGGQAGQGGREGERRTDLFHPRHDQLAGATPRPAVPPTGMAVRGIPGQDDHRRTEQSHQRCTGRHVPGAVVAELRRRRPRPQLHLLEQHDGQLGVPVHQHGPQRRPDDRDGAPGRSLEFRRLGPCRGLQDGQQTPRPRPSVPVDGPDRLGHHRQSERGELQQPHDAARPTGLRHDRRLHLADPDLGELNRM